MARTLGCLVASMTMGAAVLDWVQPERPAGQGPAIELSARGNTTQQWTSIRVDPRRPGSRVEDVHFVVDRDGNCVPTEHWVKQHLLGNLPIVRIGLLSAPHTNQASPSQWSAMWNLVTGLQHDCRIPRQGVDVNDTIAGPPQPSPFPAARRPNPVSSRRHR